ncbi:ATP-dependent Clp protease proteolytic subunit [Azospirillum doebereinerae]
MTVRTLVRWVGLGALLVAGAAGAAGTHGPLADGMAATAVPVAIPSAPPASDFPDAALARSEQGNATVLRVDGIITAGVEQRFAETLRGLPAGRPLVVELSSPGGFTSAGYKMIDAVLAERQSGRPVATRVRGGESCESMCVGLYLAGYPRYAAPSAEFMVHAPRMAENGRMTMRSTQAMVQRLVSLGASPVWIERVKAAGGFSGAVDYREKADRLTADGANIVTELIR